MELKEYFDNLTELTKIGQIKWVRRVNAAQQIFDLKIDEENSIALINDNSRASILVVCGMQTIQIVNLDVNGNHYKALSKLWDTVYVSNLKVSVEKWNGALPPVDKKIKFGPKEDKTRL